MIDFDELKECCIPQFNGGNGITKAKMFADGKIKIMISTLEVGCSIGEHTHTTSCEVLYVLSGEATCTLDGKQEVLRAGQCHYCPKGSRHSIANNGNSALVLFDVVPEL